MDPAHMLPLEQYRYWLVKTAPRKARVPRFDENSGGTDAKIMLLLETPGRATRITGKTSIDNPSVTSRNLKRLLVEVGMQRRDVLMWNLVPWDLGSETKVQPTARADRALGARALLRLMENLPRLKVMVFFGASAQAAMPVISAIRNDLVLLKSPHPSGRVLNVRPDLRPAIINALQEARDLVKAS